MLLEHPAADASDPTARWHARNYKGRTALHWAAEYGHLDVCRLLLDHGALVDGPDENGNTPLHDAASTGRTDVCRLLLDYRSVDTADPTARCRARNKKGKTALHRAAWNGRLDVCCLLLDHGAFVDDADEDGNTPVCMTTGVFRWSDRYAHVARFLLEHRAKDVSRAPPLDRKTRDRVRELAEGRAKDRDGDGDGHDAPQWRAILEDFAPQFEDMDDEAEGDSRAY